MSERSIAEIIGLTPVGRDEWYGPYYQDADGQFVAEIEIDANRMLAWLREQGHSCEITLHQNADDGVSVHLNRCSVGGPNTEAPTLHAALETAVRAVAEVTP